MISRRCGEQAEPGQEPDERISEYRRKIRGAV